MYDDRPKLIYYTINLGGGIRREQTKIGRERKKIIFLLLQLHNRSIECMRGPFASVVLRRLLCVRNFKAFRGIRRNQYLLYAALPP